MIEVRPGVEHVEGVLLEYGVRIRRNKFRFSSKINYLVDQIEYAIDHLLAFNVNGMFLVSTMFPYLPIWHKDKITDKRWYLDEPNREKWKLIKQWHFAITENARMHGHYDYEPTMDEMMEYGEEAKKYNEQREARRIEVEKAYQKILREIENQIDIRAVLMCRLSYLISEKFEMVESGKV